MTTRGVAEAAGVQAPAIYRLFGDKDGLLEAIAEYVMATQVAAKSEAARAASTSDVDPVQDLRDAWMQQIEFGTGNPAVFRLLSDPERASRSPSARAGRRVLEGRVHRLAAAGLLRVSEARAADLVQAAGVGAIQTLLAVPPDERDAGLGEAMLEAVLAHVLIEPTSRTDAGPVAAAVAFRAVAPQLEALTDAEQRLVVEWTDRVIAGAFRGARGGS